MGKGIYYLGKSLNDFLKIIDCNFNYSVYVVFCF